MFDGKDSGEPLPDVACYVIANPHARPKDTDQAELTFPAKTPAKKAGRSPEEAARSAVARMPTTISGHRVKLTPTLFLTREVAEYIVVPGLDGIAATVALLARHPGTRVVLVTVHDDPHLAERGYAAGALAYVLKHTAARELVPALRAALRDEQYISPSIRPRR